MSRACDLLRVSLGAYALGALDQAERSRVETHLVSCAVCRDELAELRAVRDVLALVPSEQVEALGAADGTPDCRSEAAYRSRPAWPRARRLVAAAAAVAALAAAAFGVLSLTGGDGATRLGTRSASATDRATGVSAQVALHSRAWGTAATLDLRGVRPHERCRLVVVSRDGNRKVAASWRASYEGEAEVRGATAVRLPAIASVEVIGDGGERLLRIPLRAGSRQPP